MSSPSGSAMTTRCTFAIGLAAMITSKLRQVDDSANGWRRRGRLRRSTWSSTGCSTYLAIMQGRRFSARLFPPGMATNGREVLIAMPFPVRSNNGSVLPSLSMTESILQERRLPPTSIRRCMARISLRWTWCHQSRDGRWPGTLGSIAAKHQYAYLSTSLSSAAESFTCSNADWNRVRASILPTRFAAIVR